MADLIDRIELMRQIAEFGREIPKDQVIGVIARQESVEVEDRPKDDLISRAEAVKRLLLCKQSRAKIVSRYDMGFVDGLSHAINILDLVPLVYIPSINIVDLAPPADRPRGRWHYSDGKPATIGQSFGVICDQCGTESEYCTNFCGECGADMRGEDE